MSDLWRAVTGVSSVTRVTDDDHLIVPRATRDGALFTADWFQAAAFEGRLFTANVGTQTTPVTFNGTYAVATPDFWLHVPSTVTVIPTYIAIGFEDTGTADVADCYAAVSATGDSAVTGTALTIRNARTDAPVSSLCTATGVVSAAGTDPNSGNYVEFWRPIAGKIEDAYNGATSWGANQVHGVSWSARTAGFGPVIQGGGSLSIYASIGADPIGYIFVAWVEVPATALS